MVRPQLYLVFAGKESIPIERVKGETANRDGTDSWLKANTDQRHEILQWDCTCFCSTFCTVSFDKVRGERL